MALRGWRSVAWLGMLVLLCGSISTAFAQESARSWTYQSLAYDSQAQAEAELLQDYPGYRHLRDIEIDGAQTKYHYWRGAAMPSETAWEYRNQGGSTLYLSEQDAHDALKIFYQALSDQRGCSSVTVIASGEWTLTGSWSNGPATDEARTYSATYTGCSYSPGGTTMFRKRFLSCPASLSWNATAGVCGGGATQTIASRPVACAMGCTKVGNPVDVANGEKYQPEPADIALGWFGFARTYHSGTATGRAALGRGWTHNHAMRLTLSGSGAIGLIREDGAEVPMKAFTGYREAVDGSGDRLTGSGPWTLRTADRSVEFDSRGRMSRQTYDDGTFLDYSHDPVDRIVAITHSTGRRIAFEYVDAAVSLEPQIAAIRVDGTPLVEYAYLNGTLETATFADNTNRRYHYEDARFPWHLTGVSIAGARYSTYGYDARGRMTSSQYAGGVGGRSFTYPAAGGAVATDANQLETTYGITSDASDEPYRQLSSSSSDGKQAARIYYPAAEDFRRRLKERVDRNGVRTRYEYAEALDAVANVQVRIHTVREAYGLPEQRDSEQRYTVDGNRLVMARTGNRELRIARNARQQATTVALKDTTTNTIRTTALAYCEQGDVDTGACPVVGLLKTIDGPRPGALDVTTYQYRTADEAGCATSPATCAYRKGDLWKVVNALGQSSEILRHDGAGRVTSAKDANGVITDLEYSARGWLTASKVRGTDAGSEADDRIVRIEYWPDGSTKRVTQPDGAFVRFEYDPAHRLTAIVDGEGNAIRYTLDNAGQRKKEEVFDTANVLRRTLSRTWNTLGQLESVSTPHPNPAIATPVTTTYRYDAEGNPDQVKDALLRETHSGYDPLGHLKRTLENATAAAGAPDRAQTDFEYDALDRLTKVIDPNGLPTSYGYNGFGEQTRLESRDTGITTFDYDSAGNRTQQIDANGKTTEYAYDGLNRITAVQYPQDSSLNVAYVYDVAQSDCTAGETFLVGRLSRMTDHSGSTTYCYNRFGDMTRKVQRTQGKTFSLQWAYAANGRLQTMTYPDGSVVDYLYDSQGRVVELGVAIGERAGSRRQLLRNATYHPFGPVAKWTYGSGRVMQRTLNRSGQPGVVQMQDQTGQPIAGLSLGYEFDAVGNLKVLRNGNQTNPLQRSYGHDGLNRLTSAEDAQAVVWQSYGYDKTGNRMASGQREIVNMQDCSGVPPGEPCIPLPPTTQWTTRTYGYLPNEHRVSTIGNTERRYDPNGNTVWIGPRSLEFMPPNPEEPPPDDPLESAAYSGTEQTAIGQEDGDPPPGIVTKTFAYSAANRMASVSLEGEIIMSYRYNGAGERVYRSGSNETVHTVFDPSGHWIGDYDATGTAIQQAIWFDGLPVGLVRNAGNALDLHYVEADALGTPRVVIDPQRDVAVWRWDLGSEAFGESEPEQDPDGDNTLFVLDMRYPGQQYDSASGFNYNYFRDYDPSVGRYVQSDPIGLAGGMSTYGYVGANPMTNVDIFGLVASVCRQGNKVAILQPVNFELGPGITREAAEKVFREAEKAWTGQIGKYDVQLHIKDGRGDPNALRVRLHHYVPGPGDSINVNNWHIPNPSDGQSWANFDWSVYGHEVGHDLLGFPGNMEPRLDRPTVMSRKIGVSTAFEVSEFDIELLLDSIRVFHMSWEACGCD